MYGQLEKHFFGFIRSVPGAEFVDELPLTAAQQAAKKADLFFESRAVIVEVKLLATDTAPKIQPILAPYENTKEWPVFFDSWPLSKILAYLPDGKKLHRKIFDSVTNSIGKVVGDANRQIRETKDSFGLRGSRGILILLNDTIDILTPEMIAHRVAETLNKKTPTGHVRYPEVGHVWILSETHRTDVGPGMKGLLSVILDHPLAPDDGKLERFLDQLQQRWAAYNRMPFLRAELSSGRVGDIPIEPVNAPPPPSQITRADLWRRQYAVRPYLRELSKDELLAYGAKLTLQAGKGFLVGFTVPPEEREANVERWTHFIEEINFRGIDLREMKPQIDANHDILKG